MVKVAVIALLSSDPFIHTYFEFLLARAFVDTGTYLEGVWSKFRVRDSEMLCFSTLPTI